MVLEEMKSFNYKHQKGEFIIHNFNDSNKITRRIFMHPRTIKMIFGSICFAFNLIALIAGVMLIFQSLPFVGEGKATAIVKVLGEITGVNGYAVGLFLGAAIVFVSLMYTHKSYQEALNFEQKSLSDVLRHHAPRRP